MRKYCTNAVLTGSSRPFTSAAGEPVGAVVCCVPLATCAAAWVQTVGKHVSTSFCKPSNLVYFCNSHRNHSSLSIMFLYKRNRTPVHSDLEYYGTIAENLTVLNTIYKHYDNESSCDCLISDLSECRPYNKHQKSL